MRPLTTRSKQVLLHKDPDNALCRLVHDFASKEVVFLDDQPDDALCRALREYKVRTVLLDDEPNGTYQGVLRGIILDDKPRDMHQIIRNFYIHRTFGDDQSSDGLLQYVGHDKTFLVEDLENTVGRIFLSSNYDDLVKNALQHGSSTATSLNDRPAPAEALRRHEGELRAASRDKKDDFQLEQASILKEEVQSAELPLSPPLDALRHRLEALVPVLYTKVLADTLADIRKEHSLAANPLKARCILLQGYGALAVAAGCELGHTLLGRIAALWQQARSIK